MSPTFSVLRVVTSHVCGMMATWKSPFGSAAGDREGDAVDGGGTFGGEIAGDGGRRADGDAEGLAFRRDRDDLADAVDMAEDEVAAELVAEPEALFEIDAVAFGPAAEDGFRQGFGDGLDREPGAAVGWAHVHDGEADAGMHDGGAEGDFGKRIAAFDLETGQPVAVLGAADGADISD